MLSEWHLSANPQNVRQHQRIFGIPTQPFALFSREEKVEDHATIEREKMRSRAVEAIEKFSEAVADLEATRTHEAAETACVASRRAFSLFLPEYLEYGPYNLETAKEFDRLLKRATQAMAGVEEALVERYRENLELRRKLLGFLLANDRENFRRQIDNILREAEQELQGSPG